MPGMRLPVSEEEFAALDLDTNTRQQAPAALEELQRRFAKYKNPGLS
jgi:hypothetical protein